MVKGRLIWHSPSSQSETIRNSLLKIDNMAHKNVYAGTVVDDVVTHPEHYDLFLASRYVDQGAATPINYKVIFDAFGVSTDKLRQMTCIMYHHYTLYRSFVGAYPVSMFNFVYRKRRNVCFALLGTLNSLEKRV